MNRDSKKKLTLNKVTKKKTGTRTHDHLVRKRTLNHLFKLDYYADRIIMLKENSLMEVEDLIGTIGGMML